ncbi:MAG: AAA family ATPase [Actinobacteria bacterium]|nr:AAA family ATPase [Actinomycetota bacterium]
MSAVTESFALPDSLAAKSDPQLIAADQLQFAAITASLETSLADLTRQLDEARMRAADLERDLEVHRLTARIRALSRYGIDLCLGRIVYGGTGGTVYIGRLGLTAADGTRLLVDWRSPAAEPFFGATHATPLGLASRRRYRWTQRRVTDYWDEVFTAEGLEHTAALDDQSAFIASLGTNRSERMRDVLGTIQADQDAIVRAGSRGALVVDGGPGTGKTVVALHRTAYLLYSDPRLAAGRGGVLFIGPHSAYVSYVSDVLPSLGEESVQTCTLRDLVPEASVGLDSVEATRLKTGLEMVRAVGNAVRMLEQPPTETVLVETPWADVAIDPGDWAEAFDAAETGLPHNEARDQVWEALLAILADKLGEPADEEVDEFDAYGLSRESGPSLAEGLASDPALRAAFGRAWPLVAAGDLVARLWSSPAFLRRCAPWLGSDDVYALQRTDARAWSPADLPLLDAAHLLLGDPTASHARQQRAAETRAERARMSDVISDLIASDDSDLHIMSMLRGQDLRATLVDDAALPTLSPDLLGGPFAHIVVDEAQELTDAEWQMLLARCPSRSFTIVGDRAQAREGFAGSWASRLSRVGFDDVSVATLSVNYRTPTEIMAEAEPIIRAVLPDANVPTSIRSTGVPVRYTAESVESVLDAWTSEGVACVIGSPEFVERDRVRSLTPEGSKGLEFDLVVLVEPERWSAVDRYVAMTRATQELVVVG